MKSLGKNQQTCEEKFDEGKENWVNEQCIEIEINKIKNIKYMRQKTGEGFRKSPSVKTGNLKLPRL